MITFAFSNFSVGAIEIMEGSPQGPADKLGDQRRNLSGGTDLRSWQNTETQESAYQLDMIGKKEADDSQVSILDKNKTKQNNEWGQKEYRK